MRTVATFESHTFNLTEERDYFPNPGCYGDDVGRWLIEKLRSAGAEPASEPEPEDFGWFVNYRLGDVPLCLVIGTVGEEFWFVVVERAAGLVGSFLGGRRRGIPPEAPLQLHQILSSADEVANLRWHTWEAFRRGGARAFDDGRATPGEE